MWSLASRTLIQSLHFGSPRNPLPGAYLFVPPARGAGSLRYRARGWRSAPVRCHFENALMKKSAGTLCAPLWETALKVSGQRL